MLEDEFTFKFPDLNLDFEEIDKNENSKSTDTLNKIYEYLDEDIEEQDILLKKLLDFERRLDQIL